MVIVINNAVTSAWRPIRQLMAFAVLTRQFKQLLDRDTPGARPAGPDIGQVIR